jgi:hypothetical protein
MPEDPFTGCLISTETVCVLINFEELGYPSTFYYALNGTLSTYYTEPTCQNICCVYSYCPYGYIYPENYYGYGLVNTGENDLTGIYCCTSKSDGTGYFFWGKVYCLGVVVDVISGNTGIISGYYSGNLLTGTGYYCCRISSDGVGGCFADQIPYEGIIFNQEPISINIFGTCYPNGYFNIISDGISWDLYGEYDYCNSDHIYFCSGVLSFKSNGNGSFTSQEIIERDLYNLCLHWDFSKRTKSSYNFQTINSELTGLCISIQDNLNLFYEINSSSETTVCLYEANREKSLFLEDSLVPFLYIKNIGNCKLNINFSSGIYFNDYFKKCQVYNKTNYYDKNVFLCKNESVFISFDVSDDGSEYYSNLNYPFGFFHEFKNIEDVNPLGFYPVCCGFDSLNDCFFPIFTYSNLNDLPIENNSVITTGYAYNYGQILSFYENLTVDKSNLEISLLKQTGTGANDFLQIQTGFELNSNYGINSHTSKIRTNEIIVSDENTSCGLLNCGDKFTKFIDSNSCVGVFYDVDFIFCKNYKLIYLDCCLSGADYDFTISVNSSSGLNSYDKNCIYSINNTLEIKNDDSVFVNLILCENSAVKDLSNGLMARNNLYLPL